jgi:hypothetical protein
MAVFEMLGAHLDFGRVLAFSITIHVVPEQHQIIGGTAGGIYQIIK